MIKRLLILLVFLIPLVVFSQTTKGIRTKMVETDTLYVNKMSTSTSNWMLVLDSITKKIHIRQYSASTGDSGTVRYIGATAGNGISVTGSPVTDSGTIVITNTKPDTTVTITGSTGIGVSGTYPNFTLTNTALGDSIWRRVGTVIFPRTITDSVGIGTTTPTADFTLDGNITYVPVVYDSADFDDGISVAELSRVMIYSDTNSSWYDWTYGGGAQLAAGQEGQVVTIFSMDDGILYLRNNEVANTVAFDMYGGDNITLKFVDNTWVEVGRVDFHPYSTCVGSGGTGGGVTYVAATAGTGISIGGSPITSSGTLVITNTAPDQTVILNPGNGISITPAYPVFSITNSKPDTTVSLTGGTGISVTGTYPTFTITNTDPASISHIVGQWPIYTSGTGTTTISINQASETDSGYITSADWNTFNNKLSSTLASANLFVGNSSNVATARDLAGDATIDNTGVMTLARDAVDSTNIQNNNVGGDKLYLTGNVQGDIMYFNGTDWVRLPAGTSGYFLKTQGGGANPMWDYASTLAAGSYLTDVTATNANGFTWTVSTPSTGVRNLSIDLQDAAANGTTKGKAAFTATDFNSASGVISIDYTNGQKASSSQAGFINRVANLTSDNIVTITGDSVGAIVGASGTQIGVDETKINHNNLSNYTARRHFTQTQIDTVATGNEGLLKASATGVLSAATAGVDYQAPITPAAVTAGSTKITLGGTPTTAALQAFSINADETKFNHDNLLNYTARRHFTQPTIDTVNPANAGILKADGSGVLSAAISGTDYLVTDKYWYQSSTSGSNFFLSPSSPVGGSTLRNIRLYNTLTIARHGSVTVPGCCGTPALSLYVDGYSRFDSTITYRNIPAKSTTPSLALVMDGNDIKTYAWPAGFTDPMTTKGDLIYRNPSNVTTRLPKGSSGQVLSTDGDTLKWISPAGSSGGTVTLIKQGLGMLNSDDSITSSGTVGIDSSKVVLFNDTLSLGKIASKYHVYTNYLPKAATASATAPDSVAYYNRSLNRLEMRVLPGAGAESDPVFAADSNKILHWYDTLTRPGIATKYDVDTITERDPVWISDSTDFLSKYDTAIGKVETRYHADATYEPKITGGDTLEYYNYNKNWVALPKDSTFVVAGTNVTVDSTFGISGKRYVINAASATGETTSAANVGVGTGIYKNESGDTLYFKTFIGGIGTAIATYDANTLQVNADTNTVLASIKYADSLASKKLEKSDTANQIRKYTIDAAGDLIIGTGNATYTRLPIGTLNQVLTSNGTTAEWSDPATGTAHNALTVGSPARGLNLNYANQILTVDTASTTDTGIIQPISYKRFDSAWRYMVKSVSATAPLTLNLSNKVISGSISQAGTATNGYLSSTDWNTFNGKESVLTFNSPLSRATNTISIPAATSSVNGYLTSTDWSTFNNKITSGVNVGSGSGTIYKADSSKYMLFKSLRTSTGNGLTISNGVYSIGLSADTTVLQTKVLTTSQLALKVNKADSATEAAGNYTTRKYVRDTYEPKITAGTTAQYWRGDKTWQTLPLTYWTAGDGGIYYNDTVTIKGYPSVLKFGGDGYADAITKILFTNEGSDMAHILMDPVDSDLQFGTVGVERFRITSSGRLVSALPTKSTAPTYSVVMDGDTLKKYTWKPGTVTSVGLSMPSIFTVTGNPITSSGTLAVTSVIQSANTFYGGPITGSPSTPTFRSISINEMNDVDTSNVDDGDILKWNGYNWVPAPDTAGGGSAVTDTVNGTNVGTNGIGIFAGMQDVTTLQLRKIYGENGITTSLNGGGNYVSVQLTDTTKWVKLADSNDVEYRHYLTPYSAWITYEPIITASDTTKFWRGDKTWQVVPTPSLNQVMAVDSTSTHELTIRGRIMAVIDSSTTNVAGVTVYNNNNAPAFLGFRGNGAVKMDDQLFGIYGSGHNSHKQYPIRVDHTVVDGDTISSDTAYAFGSRMVGMVGVASQDWDSAKYGTYLKFNTTYNDSATTRERMRIDHDGKVSIKNIPTAATTPTYAVVPDGDTLKKYAWPTPSSGGDNYWICLSNDEQRPNRVTNRSFSLSDNAHSGQIEKKFPKGTIVTWIQRKSGADDTCMAMIVSATYDANYITFTTIGDTISALFGSDDIDSMWYTMERVKTIRLSYAGTLTTADDIAGRAFIEMPYQVFGCEAYVGTAGSTNATTGHVGLNGSTTILSSDWSVASGATKGSSTYSATHRKYLASDDYLQLDVTGVSTTPPVDLYVNVFVFPRYNNFNYDFTPCP